MRKKSAVKKNLSVFVQELYCRYEDDEVSALGAQLTYYLILSFFPFLIFLITVINFTSLTSDEALTDLIAILPRESSQMVRAIITEVLASKSQTLLSLGMVAMVWTASNGMMAIIRGLNKAYDVEETRAFWKVRGISILFTIILVLVILVSFIMLIFGKVIGVRLFDLWDFPNYFETIWAIAQFTITLIILFLLFIFLYRNAPSRHLSYKGVIPGSIFSTLSWIVISILFSFYINNFGHYAKIYGSIGGVIVLLIWLYISSIIIILGGEINAILAFIREGKEKDRCKKFSVSLPFFKKKAAK